MHAYSKMLEDEVRGGQMGLIFGDKIDFEPCLLMKG